MLQSVRKCVILIMSKRGTQERIINMVEIISKFLDSLYETSKSCNEFDVYEFQKEWYKNNGYLVIFENGHHKVFHNENN